ncbi:MAG: leucine-rich repeat domain-containing protein [Bacteroidota bacterium]
MKPYLLVLFALIVGNSNRCVAQTPASEPEKQQIRQLLRTYEKDLQQMAAPHMLAAERNAGKRELLTVVEDKAIWVANDLDSLADFALVSMQKYVQELLPTHFPLGLNTSLALEKLQFGMVKRDKVRHYDYLEIRVPKTLTWQTLQKTDSSQVDTVSMTRTVSLSFFIRFNRSISIEKYKIMAINQAGRAPKLLPLPELIAWWTDLSADWKAALLKNYPMEEYPREDELENLQGIAKLSLAKTPIKDATPLAKFTQLRELDCSQTAIENLQPLSKLTLLEDLNLSRTQISSLAGIDSLFNLIKLNGSFLKLKDVVPMAGLTKLEEVYLTDNELTDLAPLTGLTQLRKLSFSNNLVTSLTPLAALVNMEELRFGKNKVDNFAVLSNFPNLIILDCFSSGLDSAEPLRNLTKLVYLNCGANPILSLDPLANHVFLLELNVTTTKIASLNALRKFKLLEILDFSNTTVTELGPVHDLDGIRVLKCQLTKVEVRDKDRFKKKHPRCEITYF